MLKMQSEKIIFTFAFFVLLYTNATGARSKPPSNKVDSSEIISGVADLVSSILDLVGDTDESGNQVDSEKIIAEVIAHIDQEIQGLYDALSLKSFFEKVGFDVRCINDGMRHLVSLVESDSTEREFYKGQFVKQVPNAIACARDLPDNFKATVPGDENVGLKLFAEKFRCNRTSLDVLLNFIYQNCEHGMMLEFTFKRLQQDLSLEMERAFWNRTLKDVNDIFVEQIEICNGQFLRLLGEDIDSAHDAKTLQKNNEERYSHLWNDVHISSSAITWYGFLKQHESLLIRRTGKRLTMVTFGALEDGQFETNRRNELRIMQENIVVVGCGSPKDSCTYLRDHFCTRNFRVVLCLMFNNVTSGMQTAYDTDSPALRITLYNNSVYLLIEDVNFTNNDCALEVLPTQTETVNASVKIKQLSTPFIMFVSVLMSLLI